MQWLEVLLDDVNDGSEGVREKVYNAVHIEFRNEQVEERVLAVALVKLRYLVLQLVEKWKARARVGETGHHLAYVGLQRDDFILHLLVLLLEGAALLFSVCKLLGDYTKLALRLSKLALHCRNILLGK